MIFELHVITTKNVGWYVSPKNPKNQNKPPQNNEVIIEIEMDTAACQ